MRGAWDSNVYLKWITYRPTLNKLKGESYKTPCIIRRCQFVCLSQLCAGGAEQGVENTPHQNVPAKTVSWPEH